MRIHRLFLPLGLALLLASAGCQSPTRTVTTTETRECTVDEDGERECETVSRTTHTEEAGHEVEIFGCDGIVSCTFSAAGQVIALPFRILGLVFDVIF